MNHEIEVESLEAAAPIIANAVGDVIRQIMLGNVAEPFEEAATAAIERALEKGVTPISGKAQ